MKELEKTILDKMKDLLISQVSLYRMILFGSRARGDAQPDSDMDVLVVVDGQCTPEIRYLVSECAWEAGFEHGIVISTVVYSREEWENGPERHSLLALAVNQEGIPL